MKAKPLSITMALVFLTGAPQAALAVSSYLTVFNGLYKTTATRLNSCRVCHTKPPTLNPYGKAFSRTRNAGVAPRAALKQIQPRDSDRDGFTNIVEIRARTFPGNRKSKPPKSPDTLAASGTAASDSSSAIVQKRFTRDFQIQECNFASTGRNRYFILEPGYQLTLEGIEDGKSTRLVITVLNDTKQVDGVETRVVEEIAAADGQLQEVARNYFAICQNTNTVFYFGEDVDNYVNGQVVDHDGSWLAGVGNARPGVVMPGIILLGSRYFQELAPRVAMDRAEIVSTSKTVRTRAGDFRHCLKTEETTPLEPRVKEFKLYAPEVGLVKDGPLKLVSHGFVTN